MNIKFENSNQKKYELLGKLIKSCLSISNGNADVKRSLSDNKNTLTVERTNLSDEALVALRRCKEHARQYGGSEKVCTLSKEITTSVQQSHRKFSERKKLEHEELEIAKRKEEQAVEEERLRQALIDKSVRKHEKLDAKKEKLQKIEEEVTEEYEISLRMLKEAKLQLDNSIAANDMVGIRVAQELYSSVSEKVSRLSELNTKQSIKRAEIGSKRKCAFEKLMNNVENRKKM